MSIGEIKIIREMNYHRFLRQQLNKVSKSVSLGPVYTTLKMGKKI
jgi:hypothetical protein